jgi:hypothetical protein
MDPLSITTSIIAIIQLTGSVISAAYNYLTGLNNAAEDAMRITGDLTGLLQILEKLLKLLEKDRSTGSSQLTSVNTLTRSDGPLETCQLKSCSPIAIATIYFSTMVLDVKYGVDNLTALFGSYQQGEETRR